MLLAESFSSAQYLLLGISLLIFGFVLRRGFHLNRKSAARDIYLETRTELARKEQQALHGIQQLELRLYDYDRQVQGRIDTTLTLLEQLLDEADRESRRLVSLLQELKNGAAQNPARRADIVGPAVTFEEAEEAPSVSFSASAQRAPLPISEELRQTISHLAEAGYNAGQIARLVEKPIELVELVLRQQPPGRAAA